MLQIISLARSTEQKISVFTCSFPIITDLLFSEIEMCYLIHQWNLILLKNKMKFSVCFFRYSTAEEIL